MTNWHKGVFRITRATSTAMGSSSAKTIVFDEFSAPVEGWLSPDGLWGVRRGGGEWHLTHLPTGFFLPYSNFRTLAKVREFAERITPLRRDWLWFKGCGRYNRKLAEAIRKASEAVEERT